MTALLLALALAAASSAGGESAPGEGAPPFDPGALTGAWAGSEECDGAGYVVALSLKAKGKGWLTRYTATPLPGSNRVPEAGEVPIAPDGPNRFTATFKVPPNPVGISELNGTLLMRGSDKTRWDGRADLGALSALFSLDGWMKLSADRCRMNFQFNSVNPLKTDHCKGVLRRKPAKGKKSC